MSLTGDGSGMDRNGALEPQTDYLYVPSSQRIDRCRAEAFRVESLDRYLGSWNRFPLTGRSYRSYSLLLSIPYRRF